MSEQENAEVIIVGGGIAGLSAAIYLGRAERETLVIDSGKSMARWEPEVENYLGFPEGIAGEDLLRRGRDQADRYGIRIINDEIVRAQRNRGQFVLSGKHGDYRARRLLLATGIFHLPPEIEGVSECLGHTLFFCKDCDGFRVRGKRIGIYGWTNEAVEYALAMLFYSARVFIVTDGRAPRWGRRHAHWIREYSVPVYYEPIVAVGREAHEIRSFKLPKGSEVELDALFTTRGDVYRNKLGRSLGARLDTDGQILVDSCMRTSVKGLYAAGCVTPANCQIIIAAGQGAVAAQSINRDLFTESLATHSLRRFRGQQLWDLRLTNSSLDRKTILETNRRNGNEPVSPVEDAEPGAGRKRPRQRKPCGKRRQFGRTGASQTK
jgi:thioredoxin reductase (NADPH)